MAKDSLGFDFGTESARVIVVDIANGRIVVEVMAAYAHRVVWGDATGIDGSHFLPWA